MLEFIEIILTYLTMKIGISKAIIYAKRRNKEKAKEVIARLIIMIISKDYL